jgi:hypothetical protein
MTNTNLKFGLAISALLALTDVAGLAGTGTADAPPFIMIAASAVIGLITFGSLRPAWRQVPAGLWTVIVTRGVSALASFPPFFIDVPAWIRIACAVSILLTVVAVGLLLPYVRRVRSVAATPA